MWRQCCDYRCNRVCLKVKQVLEFLSGDEREGDSASVSEISLVWFKLHMDMYLVTQSVHVPKLGQRPMQVREQCWYLGPRNG
jgi:hypothetical protein